MEKCGLEKEYFEIPRWPSEIPANNYEKNFGKYK